ncbi:Rieske 2Fe-2S domain-containing protein [Rubinisphaera sp.]|uniref:Rieske (2Fe-2S) protein n=1 Tax=Rubinisphaera sp. TaxID=2024857 RepID=UPI000C0FAB95|nr:Rieske 2Fe-2S domain-containing protein [Rubinisphaera sp.]MBV09439.1 nitrite reductase [Rubinisphaera sp.]HCS52811.1 nitrite reductase [Planctomycetaceae bacterium]|tara:strand:- start:1124 stop:1474 length:351 start_codon:yes stop_codon:yes gene_type:complete
MNEKKTSYEEDYDFLPAAQMGDVEEGKGVSLRLNGHVVGLFHSNGKHFAISDFCPHQGAQLTGGYVEDGVVMCPWHAWKFRLCDGAWADSPKSPLRCPTYPVRIVGEEIQVGIPRN